MAKIFVFPMKNIDEKWESVRNYFENCYKIKFKDRPTQDQIEDLYKKMKKLEDELLAYQFRKPHLARNVGHILPAKVPHEDA